MREKNFCELVGFSQRKLSQIAHWAPKDATPFNFAEETFGNSYKTLKFTKVFFLESFLLCGSVDKARKNRGIIEDVN